MHLLFSEDKPKGKGRGRAAKAKEPEPEEPAEEEESAEEKEEAEESDEKEQAEVAVEHCRSWQVFKKRAVELCDQLKNHFENINFKFTFNAQGTPRRGAFEITVKKSDGGEHLVWTGLKKGPPRKEKFPTAETLAGLLKTVGF